MDWNKILNWELKSGSHEFPGPSGGTCINEAAVVAAGFAYRSVGGPDDLPTCFSPVISEFALQLNDGMPDDLRQELMLPFVVRLAGTASTDSVEVKRAVLLANGVINMLHTIRPILRNEFSETWLLGRLRIISMDMEFLSVQDVQNMREAATVLAGCAGMAVVDIAGVAYHLGVSDTFWRQAVVLLEEAIMAGRHDQIGVEVAQRRLMAAKGMECVE
jgi:hypothetical protein